MRRGAHGRPRAAGHARRGVAVALLVTTLAVALPVRASAAPALVTVQVGSATLTRCGTAPVAYCGRLAVPLDRADPGSPLIGVVFRWYPASAPPGGTAKGTVLPVEGGPGYPSIGSVRGGYDVMYGSLLTDHNLLAVDLRGTGGSTALDCPGLQQFTGQPSGPAFAATAGTCASALDHRWRDAAGHWIHASDLFTSAAAAADVADIVHLLGLGRVDVYGDSYGSWFAQVLASRYPALVRSVVLDSTYSTVTIDPWYRSSHTSMAADVDAACARAPACASAAPGPAWDRVAAAAAQLRSAPASGVVPDATGRPATVTMGVVGLVDLVNDAAGDPLIYRSLDAADRSLLAGDPAPLLRLYAERLASDENYTGTPASAYSGELYLAVSCLDYPQLFSLDASTPGRVSQLATAAAALPPSTFAPFSTDEWLLQDQNTEAYTACLDWPAPTTAVPPTTGSLPLLPARVPVLVLGGEFDTWTPPVDVPGILGQLGGHSRFVELANATHVVGEGDQACASTLIQAFVRSPARLDALDASCAAAVPPIRAVGRFDRSLDSVVPVAPGPANDASGPALQAAAAAVATAGDAVARVQAIGDVPDVGLHGGSVVPGRGGTRLMLTGDQLVPGVVVSGTIDVGPTDVVASLTVGGAGVPSTSVRVSWPTSGAGADAQVTGIGDGVTLVGSCPAP